MLENLKRMHTASLTTTVMEVSPHRNFARGQVGIEELIDALFDPPEVHYSVPSGTITPYVRMWLFQAQAEVDARLGSYAP